MYNLLIMLTIFAVVIFVFEYGERASARDRKKPISVKGNEPSVPTWVSRAWEQDLESKNNPS